MFRVVSATRKVVYEQNPRERREIYELLEVVADVLNDVLGALFGTARFSWRRWRISTPGIDLLKEGLKRGN